VSKIEIQGGTRDTGEEDQGIVGPFVVAGHDDEFYLGGRETKHMSQHICSVGLKRRMIEKELVLIQRQVKSTKCKQMPE
jgi:hypothetical protein